MKHSKFSRFLCVALSAIMSLGVTSCGQSEDIVDDYGSGSSDVASISDAGTSGDTAGDSSGAAGTLQDQFGKTISWDEEFTVDGIRFTPEVSYNISADAQGMNVYNARAIKDNKDYEAALVKSLFGDTAEKIEELKYVNETDYISMLYKYRQIMLSHDRYEANVDSDEYVWIDPDYSVINGAFEETYKWLDETNLYIHMYEGEIDGKRFGLIYSFDYIGNQRNIFIEPISIKEYFPEQDYKTLMVKGSNNYLGQPLDIENACSENSDEIKKQAREFVEDKLKISGNIDISEESELYTMICTNDIMLASSGSYIYGTNGLYDSGHSILEFSDSDFISSLRKHSESGISVDYRILAEQKDIYKQYTEEHPDKNIEIYNMIMESTTAYDEYIEDANVTVDGYAVFLGSGVYSGTDLSEGISVYSPNVGMIMYTSKGFYGADITISEEITDIKEDVNLLGFDKIKESVEAGLAEKFDKDKMELNAKGVYIDRMYLTYTPYSDDPESGEFSYIPTWTFILTSDAYIDSAMLSINAMDGSVVDLYYYGG